MSRVEPALVSKPSVKSIGPEHRKVVDTSELHDEASSFDAHGGRSLPDMMGDYAPIRRDAANTECIVCSGNGYS